MTAETAIVHVPTPNDDVDPDDARELEEDRARVLAELEKEDTEEPLTWSGLCHSIKNRTPKDWARSAVNFFFVCFFLYFFLFSLDLMGAGFKVVGGCSAGGLFNDINNPIAGLMIGILATVLVQSSSTSTSIVVSLVGAGSMSVSVAVPVIMGANIGTSITNTIVSLGQINNKEEFRRAFAGATVHDMFNFLTVAVMLPLELIFGLLERLTSAMVPDEVADGDAWEGPIKAWVGPLVDALVVVNKDVTTNIAKGKTTCDKVYEGTVHKPGLIKCASNGKCPAFFHENATVEQDMTAGGVITFISLVLLCVCLVGLVKTLNRMVMGTSTRALRKATSMHPVFAIIIGCVITILVQSSSITTSVLTPLVGLNILTVDQMYPLTLGANIGTTCTALLASMVSTKPESVQIALCHLFFNLFGTLIFFPIPFMRQIPIRAAKALGEATTIYRSFPLFYIAFAFIILPFILLGVSSLYTMKGVAFHTLGVFATVALGAAVLWFTLWFFKRGGKQSLLKMMNNRQERNEMTKALPQTIKTMQAEIAELKNFVRKQRELNSGAASKNDNPQAAVNIHVEGEAGPPSSL